MTIKACQELSTIQGHFYNNHVSCHISMSFFSCLSYSLPSGMNAPPCASVCPGFMAICDYSLLKSDYSPWWWFCLAVTAMVPLMLLRRIKMHGIPRPGERKPFEQRLFSQLRSIVPSESVSLKNICQTSPGQLHRC